MKTRPNGRKFEKLLSVDQDANRKMNTLVAGMQDLYPDDYLFFNWLSQKWTTTANAFCFQQYEPCALDNIETYRQKLGDAVDDILKEMFVVDQDLVLRPEVTPGFCRMILNSIKTKPLPLKWSSISSCWRNETATTTRRRQFYQWNADIVGAENVRDDVEILYMLVSFFQSIGLTQEDIVIKVSNRRILEELFRRYKISPEKYTAIFNVIDKIDKLPIEKIDQMLFDIIDDADVSEIIINFVYINDVNVLTQYLGKDCPAVVEMQQIFRLLEIYDIYNWVSLDLTIVRGLSYYTGLVFEGFSKNTSIKRAVCGGGRYDNLLQKYGYDQPVNSLGFGMGDIVVREILLELGKMPKLQYTIDYFIVAFGELYDQAVGLSIKLRKLGYRTELCKSNKKMRVLFGMADRMAAKKIILLAPDEWSRGAVVVKNLNESKQQEVSVSDLLV